LHTKNQVLQNCNTISSIIDSTKRGYPGLDLIIFPEYSTQGFHPTKWLELSTTIPGQETEIFSNACRRNNVWGVFSITGEYSREGKPWDSLIVINNHGDIVMKYRKINPWVPQEPWQPGNKTFVIEGPKGLKMGGIICYDTNFPEICRDLALKGAELIVSIQGYMSPFREQQRMVSQVRAWENLSYFAVANLAGSDSTYSYYGYSRIIGYDGRIITECDGGEGQITFTSLSISSIRDARTNWTAENHLYNLTHRGYIGSENNHEGESSCPYDYIKTWRDSPIELKKQTENLTHCIRYEEKISLKN
jgi:amidase